MALVELEIRVRPEAFAVEEEHLVLRQPPRPHVSYVVDRVFFMVECLFCLLKEIDVQIHIYDIQLQEYNLFHWTHENGKSI